LGFFLFFLRELASNLRRNPLVAMATITTVTVLTLLLGLFVALMQNLQLMGHELEADIQIVAYLDDSAEASGDQLDLLNAKIRALPGVQGVRLIHKEAALKHLMERMNGRIDLADIRRNPLPNSFEIRVDKPTNLRPVADKVAGLKGVTKVKFGEAIAHKMMAFNKTLRTVGLSVLGLLFVSTVLVISNTIRLTVFARRKEIEVMQMVGAAGWFIQIPFLLEGLIQGLLGSALGAAAVSESYTLLVPQLSKAVPFIPVLAPEALMPQLIPAMLGLGAVVGGLGSFLSVSRYVKV
jgi:cell division transport system permease protein